MKTKHIQISYIRRIVSFVVLLLMISPPLFALELVCTKVEMQINQKLTLERQAFVAQMKINNNMPATSLADVTIDVFIKNSDKENVGLSWSSNDQEGALFSIRKTISENIEFLNDKGTIEAEKSAEISWQIIPAPLAAGGNINGAQYSVGATLQYTVNGEVAVINVEPDLILVKPLPELTLDYFLPENVLADDPLTTEIEPPIPFTFGLQVSNGGVAIAKDMKINSAYPKIISNDQGIIASFVIDGSELDGELRSGSMLVDFGDIEPGSFSTARWFMHTALSGKFSNFNAEYSHSDELGGTLTSIISQTNKHTLIHDVLVDVNGRDNINDFLAMDGEIYKVYETDGARAVVSNQSELTSLSFISQSETGRTYSLTVPQTSGFLYVKTNNPEKNMTLSRVIRSDGKDINTNNFWVSQMKTEDQTWEYNINIFDVNVDHSYKVFFTQPEDKPLPPVIQYIPGKTRYEKELLSFVVMASDPNGTVPVLTTSMLPVGASFRDGKNGTGFFEWTPMKGQAGEYTISFTASDGVLKTSKQTILRVKELVDTDNDGMPDDWEMKFFGSLDRNGLGDYDGDGISDLLEYIRHSDPSLIVNAPKMPGIIAPENRGEVDVYTPSIEIQNSVDPNGDTVTYDFELYSESKMSNLVQSAAGYSETSVDSTVWPITESLIENSWYYWRVRATDGNGYSLWKYGSFFVNVVNSPPGLMTLSSVANNSTIHSLTPSLIVMNENDPDNDEVNYTFNIYDDSSMTGLVATYDDLSSLNNIVKIQTTPSTGLNDKTTYYWKATATDIHGAVTDSDLFSFHIDTETVSPEQPEIIYPISGEEVSMLSTELRVSNDINTGLMYIFELADNNRYSGLSYLSSGELLQGASGTQFPVAGLNDNTNYYWRVKSIASENHSEWAIGEFFVNAENDRPEKPLLINPGNGSWTGSLTPVLSTRSSVDVDNDNLTYLFELYSDELLQELVAESSTSEAEWVVSAELQDNKTYYWRSAVKDNHGLQSEWTEKASFFVRYESKDSTINIVGFNQTSFPIENVKISLFTTGDTYLGQQKNTDLNGNVIFNIPDGDYKVKIDYSGYSFWSGNFVPGDFSFKINHGNADVHVHNAGANIENAKISVLNKDGEIVMENLTTDINGKYLIQLPVQKYQFKIEYLGGFHESTLTDISSGASTAVEFDLSL